MFKDYSVTLNSNGYYFTLPLRAKDTQNLIELVETKYAEDEVCDIVTRYEVENDAENDVETICWSKPIPLWRVLMYISLFTTGDTRSDVELLYNVVAGGRLVNTGSGIGNGFFRSKDEMIDGFNYNRKYNFLTVWRQATV